MKLKKSTDPNTHLLRKASNYARSLKEIITFVALVGSVIFSAFTFLLANRLAPYVKKLDALGERVTNLEETRRDDIEGDRIIHAYVIAIANKLGIKQEDVSVIKELTVK